MEQANRVTRKGSIAASRVAYLLFLVIAAWYVMTWTHELGHLVSGWSCGSKLQSVTLLPWQLPSSYFEPDRCPLLTVWGGPVLGVLFPLLAAVLLRRDAIWFIATFCIVANGVYLAVGWFVGHSHLDTARLLEHGASPLTILLYCLMTIPLGYIGFRHYVLRILAPRNEAKCGKTRDGETKCSETKPEETKAGETR